MINDIKRNVRILFLTAITSFILCPIKLDAQIHYTNVKAALILQFTNHITWPNEQQIDTFKIGFLSVDSAVYDALNEYLQQNRIKNKPVRIIRQLDTNQLPTLDLLYIDNSRCASIQTIAQQIENKNILLVSEQCSNANYMMLNILYNTIDQKASFEINKTNLVIEGFTINPNLLLLGGTEVDVRELYRETIKKLDDEKLRVRLQRDTIRTHMNEIAAIHSIIDSLESNVVHLQANIQKYADESRQLIINISEQQKEIQNSNLELEKKKSELEEYEKEIRTQREKLFSLTEESTYRKIQIDKQNDILKKQGTLLKSRTRNLIISVALAFTLLLLGLSIYTALVLNRRKKSQVEEKNKLLKQQQLEIQEINEELETSNEEINSANEELINQKEELQDTLRMLQQTQQKLIQSEKMASLGTLIAGVSHEINNPINFISSSIYGMENIYDDLFNMLENADFKDKSKVSEMKDRSDKLMKSMQAGVDRTAQIVKSLSSFARDDKNEFKEVDIHEYIETTLVILNNNIKNRVTIQKHYAELPLVNCMPGKISQVLMNILNNAIQKKKKNGEVTITTRLEDNHHVHISVKDTGIGIPEEIVNRIFDPFFTTKEINKGMGLGLSIVYEIVKQHQGDIQVHSEPGKGSEFIIDIPLK